MDLEFRDATRKPCHPVGVELANKGSANEAREDIIVTWKKKLVSHGLSEKEMREERRLYAIKRDGNY